MGETKETLQGISSVEDKGSTSEQETPTFTKSQVDKIRSDERTEAGRLRKQLEGSVRNSEALLKRLNEKDEEDLRREEVAADGDPGKLSELQRKRQIARREAEAEQKLKDAEAKEADAQTKYQKILSRHAVSLSEKYNVDSNVLLKYAGADEEAMEELAKSFGERTGESTETLSRPDRSKTRGEAKGLTAADVQKMTPAELIANYKEIAKMPLGL